MNNKRSKLRLYDLEHEQQQTVELVKKSARALVEEAKDSQIDDPTFGLLNALCLLQKAQGLAAVGLEAERKLLAAVDEANLLNTLSKGY